MRIHNQSPPAKALSIGSECLSSFIALLFGLSLTACGGTENTSRTIDLIPEQQLASTATPKRDDYELALALHEDILVLDGHVDVKMPSTNPIYIDPDGTSKITPAKLAAGGVDAVVMTIQVESGPREPNAYAQARSYADSKLARILKIASDSADSETTGKVVIVHSADELVQAHENGNIAILLGLQNARILERDISSLDEFYEKGVRVFSLTHLGHNDFADSSRVAFDFAADAYEPTEEHGGLSQLGRAAITRINELGGVLDVTQLSRAATLQAIEHSTQPVIASHSNVRSISNATRNLSDEEIDKIAESGGVIHITAFTGYLVDLSSEQLIADIKSIRHNAGIEENYVYPFDLSWKIEDPELQMNFLIEISNRLGTANVEHMIDHIDYLVERIGIDHVGVSSDFDHGGGIEGFSNATEAVNITAALLSRGYSNEDIEKIWSGNFLRVLRINENAVKTKEEN